jgi:hypothetical protein
VHHALVVAHLTNPASGGTTDQAHTAARDNVLGYVNLMKSLLDSGVTVDEAVSLMCQTLYAVGVDEGLAVAMFAVALAEMAGPAIDLSAFEA